MSANKPVDESPEPVEEIAAERPSKGVYILPNLFTTAGLFAGFFSIIQATQGQYGSAAVAIFVAMVMDGLDGRIARWTNTTSDFGKEYDSLADVIAFGLAPALLTYEWILRSMGKAGWIVAFLFVAGAAMRLARFNTVESADRRYFQGLPCPAAAAAAAAFVWLCETVNWSGGAIGVAGAFISLGLTLGMVSSVRYRSFKELDVKGRVSFDKAFLFAIVIGIVFWEPPLVLCLVATSYALSGPVSWCFDAIFGRRRKRDIQKHDQTGDKNPDDGDQAPAGLTDRDSESTDDRSSTKHLH